MPRSTYLKVVGDFCRWNGRIVFGCDDTAKAEFTNKRKAKGDLAGPGQSQSNLWFVESGQLDKFGPLLGRGAVWMNESVQANEASDPYLFSGYEHRMLYLRHKNAEDVSVTIELDAEGTGDWSVLKTIVVPTGTNGAIERFSSDISANWIRLKTNKNVAALTAMFHYRGNDDRDTAADKRFDGLARLDDTKVSGGVMLARGGGFKTLRCVMQDENGPLGVYDLDGNLKLTKADDPNGEIWTTKYAAIPTGILQIDDASVLFVDEKGRWRLPKGDLRRDENGPLGDERICREVATERDLFHAHGTFYELPAENSGGVQKIRPIASHPFRIKDFASYRGMIVLSGVSVDAVPNARIIKSDDGKTAVWCGTIDDLWNLGKVRGIGGPWKKSQVKADEPSDPYLMTGYDKKRLELSHDNKLTVDFHIELDVCGNGDWIRWTSVAVESGKIFKTDLPMDAYWIRFVPTQSCLASATLIYE